MNKAKIVRRIAMLISLVMLITSMVNTTYGFIVTSTDPIVNTFLPEDVNVNGLAISKTVEHPLGADYKIPDNITFDFKVELGAYYANAKLNTTQGEMTADASGNLTMTIKPGTTLGIEGLDEGTTVKVTELATELDGFAPTDSATTKEVTIGTDGNASVSFVNTYTPNAVKATSVTVNGFKVLEGRDWQTGDSFSFKLEYKDGEGWTELGTKMITYVAENADFNKFDFSDIMTDITFDKVGIYAFRMSEIKGELENVDYDQTVNHFTVKVTDVDMDGKLEINAVVGTENAKVTAENGKYTVSVAFNNTFVPPVIPDPDSITVNVTVNKKVTNTGKVSIGPDGFEFVLENLLTQEKKSLDSDGNGKAVFALTFTKADVGKAYTYKLSETNEGVAGMTYDTDVYEITVAITLNDNNVLVATATVGGQAAENIVAEFQNTYHADTPVAPPTGDNSNLTFWFIMMIVSGTTLIILAITDKRKSARV